MALRYNVVLLQPQGYAPSFSFLDLGRLLLHSLRSLSLSCEFSLNQLAAGTVNVLLGYHLLPGLPASMAGSDFVIYQLEQLPGHPRLPLAGHMELFQRARCVWDYSQENVDFLRQRGLTNVQLLPIGFHPALHTIAPRQEEIDVLFYGLLNERRSKVLDALSERRVEKLFGLYGDSRDAYIARSRVVLNVHYYPVQIFEQVRIAYLLNNRRCVVSEDSPHNPYEGGLVTGKLAELPGLCRQYLEDPDARARVATAGFELLRERPMANFLRSVL